MRCENIFCIYWSDDKCVLDKVEMDIQGRCNSCIYVKINENELQVIREEQRRNIEYDCSKGI